MFWFFLSFGELFHFTFLLPELQAEVGKIFRKPEIFARIPRMALSY